ncbi:MAG TPA: DNA ligase D [Polyangia bacterium]|nr:DNA ligase D [Polyangia bacterium]
MPAKARAALPPYEPQLATLVEKAPTGDDWLHELKYDGYRIGIRLDEGSVKLLSRRGKDWTAQFPELVAAARKLQARQALVDGEAAIVLPSGKTDFQALQNFFGGDRRGLAYFAFDLLHLDGEDLRARPVEERKERLQRLLRASGAPILRLSEHVVGNGPAFFAEAGRMGLEGIISKRAGEPYRAGRTTSWLKAKCIKEQELVIGGFTDPEGAREGIGALLLGVYQGERLAFAGKVGTGFTMKGARELRKKLEAIVQKSCPFDPPPTGPDRLAYWVKPVLVAQVKFAEWTSDGKIRHSSFLGLREDKDAREVVMEVASAISGRGTPPSRPPPARGRSGGGGASRPATAPSSGKKQARVDVAGISLSNPDRVLYPKVGVTKLDLARYYEGIEKWILPHVLGRPLSLVRCPKGLTGEPDACFYMKHSEVWAPPALKRVSIKEKTKRGQYLVIEDLAGVIALAQMDCLEIHTWNSPADDVERPDRVVFDLDPGPEVPFAQVIEAARLVRGSLESLELESFVKNTGSNGLHVVVPLSEPTTWEDGLEFTRQLSLAIARARPDRYTTDIPKAGREKKILIDFLRNVRGSTSVAAFSTRARDNASVSVPLSWEELSPKVPSDHFTVRSLPQRLARLRRDPWEKYGKTRQRLDSTTLEAVASLR